MISAIVLALFTGFAVGSTDSDESQRAIYAASRAFYVQSGVRDSFQEYEKRLLTDRQREAVAATIWVNEALTRQYVTYTIRF